MNRKNKKQSGKNTHETHVHNDKGKNEEVPRGELKLYGEGRWFVANTAFTLKIKVDDSQIYAKKQ